MARIRWTAEAELWLKDIYDYIAADNPDAAARVINGIYEKAQTLKKFPDIGYIHRFEEDGEIRILLYGHSASPISDERRRTSWISWESSTGRWT